MIGDLCGVPVCGVDRCADCGVYGSGDRRYGLCTLGSGEKCTVFCAVVVFLVGCDDGVDGVGGVVSLLSSFSPFGVS